MDGRDIGTVVLPKADVKIFLTASPEVRAKRRCDELNAKGQKANFEQTLKDIQQRDYQDTHRPIAPLKMARDSIKLDTSELDIDGVLTAIEAIITPAKQVIFHTTIIFSFSLKSSVFPNPSDWNRIRLPQRGKTTIVPDLAFNAQMSFSNTILIVQSNAIATTEKHNSKIIFFFFSRENARKNRAISTGMHQAAQISFWNSGGATT
jgi:hypothetical protein